MSDIEKAIVKILNSEELFEKLCEAKTLEDAYDFCISVHGGYTLQEFEEFLENIDVPDFEKIDKEINLDEKIGLDEKRNLNNISGGKRKSNYSKALAVSLSMMTMAYSITPMAQGAVTASKTPPSNISRRNTKKVSFWQKYKRYFAYAGIAGGAIAGLALLYAVNGKLSSSDDAGDASKTGTQPQENFYRRIKNWIGDHILPRWGPIEAGKEAMTDIAGLSKTLVRIGGASWIAKNAWNKFKEYKNRLDKKIDNEELNFRDAQENLEELLKTISGQEKAKEEIRAAVTRILHKRNQARFKGEDYRHGDVLYFAGPSGVGKTLMAEGLAQYKVLSNTTDVFIISASEVDKETTGESVVEQLFGMSRGYSPWGGSFGMGSSGGRNVMSEQKSLVKYLNQNSDGLVIINEYDKMCTPALDEVFRTIIDQGVVNVKGQKIDCSGITFILTSNESAASLKIDDSKPDNTGSRTEIKHDTSFLNRVHPIEFDNLSIEDYKKIIDKEIRNDVVNYWSSPEVAGMDLVIDDECLENMAKVVREKDQGARYIDVITGELFSAATGKISAKKAETGKEDYYKGKKVYVSYDPDKKRFTLTDEDEKK